MFKVFTKKRTMNTIAQELLEMNRLISSFATKLPSQYEFLFRYLYRLDEQEGRLESFIDFLYKEMDYKHNQFSRREILEIYISFSRPTLQYKKNYKPHYRTNTGMFAPATSFPPKNSPSSHYQWEKVNYAQILLENCDRADFLRLLTSYNRHPRILLYPEKSESKLNVVDMMITKDSELYKLCTNYFTINAGFQLGFNIACLKHTFLKEGYLGLAPNMDSDIDSCAAQVF